MSIPQYMEVSSRLVTWLCQHLPEGVQIPKDLVDEVERRREPVLRFIHGPDASGLETLSPLTLPDRLALDQTHLEAWIEMIGTIVANPAEAKRGAGGEVVFVARTSALVSMTPFEARQAAQSLLAAADRAEYGCGHGELHAANMAQLGGPEGLSPAESFEDG